MCCEGVRGDIGAREVVRSDIGACEGVCSDSCARESVCSDIGACEGVRGEGGGTGEGVRIGGHGN